MDILHLLLLGEELLFKNPEEELLLKEPSKELLLKDPEEELLLKLQTARFSSPEELQTPSLEG